jgi:predicted ATPase
MNHPFGDLLGQFLHRKHGLSQYKLADGINQPPSVVSEMCQGKRLTGKQARERIVAILLWLHQQGALITEEEANALLQVAGMAPLREAEEIEARLLRQLSSSSKQHSWQFMKNWMAEPPTSQAVGERSTAAPRNNLPIQPVQLIGRESETAEILETLNQPACRLLTLTGQGGIGKTQLAIHAVAQIAARGNHPYPDGIFFTALQLTGDASSLAQAVIDAIGLPISGADDPRKGLIHFLQEQRMLLLLDNFEGSLQSSPENATATLAFVADLIQQAPGLKLLVTSRVVLHLSSEWVYPVAGLSFPSTLIGEMTAPLPGMEDLNRFPAIRLFVERARRVQHNFSPAEEMSGIVQICQVVGGLPLALEMAATWTKMMSCAAIAAEIQNTLAFLEMQYPDVPLRHRSVLAVINQSWQTLSPEEREVFARLSVFQGGIQRDAAEQVAGATLSILSGLVDKSLLRWEPDDRFHFHELLRQFAHDQLQADPQLERDTCALHCMYFADLMDECSAGITGPHQQEVLRRITANIQNIRAAWQQAVADANLAAFHKAAYTFYEFCDFTSHYLEGAEAFEQAISRLLESRYANLQAAEMLAMLYNYVGEMYIRLGKYELSEKAFQSCQTVLQAHGLAVRPGFGTDPNTGLSLLALVKGDYAAAVQFGKVAHDAGLLRDDPLNLQVACYMLASAFFSFGEYPSALEHVKQGLYFTETTGNRWFKGQLLTVQGQIVLAQNQYPLAKRIFQEVYQIKQEMIDLEGEANALNHLAEIALLQGEPQEAQRLYQKGLNIILCINDPGGVGGTYAGLGATALANGDFTAACRYYTQGLQIALQIQWFPLTISLLTGISDLLLGAGRVDQSAALLYQVMAHPAITDNARIRARQRLERAVSHRPSAQPPFQASPPIYSGQSTDWKTVPDKQAMPNEQAIDRANEDLLRISRTLLVELASLTIQNPQIESPQ